MRYVIWTTLALAACTNEPDDAPRGNPLPEACNTCLSAVDAGGCGTEESACSADSSCDAALLCALQFDCWSRHASSDCEAQYECAAPDEGAAPLLEAIEACARTQCADECDYGAP